MKHGYLMMVLHAHLPFVRHPEFPRFLEEMWLFEAISETYIPLLRMLDRLEADGVPVNLCLNISPTLASMLSDETLIERYVGHLDRLIALGEREIERTAGDAKMNALAHMYLEMYSSVREDFHDRYDRNVTGAFARHAEEGRIELITTFATHPYMPLYQHSEVNAAAQLKVALDTHERFFSTSPSGIWLPECGYYPGLEQLLEQADLRYFFTASHGLLFADERPRNGVYAPVRCPNGVFAFGREMASTEAVWSNTSGYPGNHVYRDFYRDIGHDLPMEYLHDAVDPGGIRANTGYKYWAITGATDEKELYDPEAAKRKIDSHSDNFMFKAVRQCRRVSSHIDRDPVIVSPFDAELFGHWWFEGVSWLESLYRRMHRADQEGEDCVVPILPSDYLAHYQDAQTLQPAFSSWGNKGYSEVWLDGSNDWIYRHSHKAIERMIDLVERYPDESGLKLRALNQAAREVLLAQASDWPFIMRSGTTVTYAVRRVKEHINNFTHIYDSLSRGVISTEWLTRVEKRNNIFPDIDYRMFSADGRGVRSIHSRMKQLNPGG